MRRNLRGRPDKGAQERLVLISPYLRSICGTGNKSSLKRPACHDCYRKHKGKLPFADD